MLPVGRLNSTRHPTSHSPGTASARANSEANVDLRPTLARRGTQGDSRTVAGEQRAPSASPQPSRTDARESLTACRKVTVSTSSNNHLGAHLPCAAHFLHKHPNHLCPWRQALQRMTLEKSLTLYPQHQKSGRPFGAPVTA